MKSLFCLLSLFCVVSCKESKKEEPKMEPSPAVSVNAVEVPALKIEESPKK